MEGIPIPKARGRPTLSPGQDTVEVKVRVPAYTLERMRCRAHRAGYKHGTAIAVGPWLRMQIHRLLLESVPCAWCAQAMDGASNNDVCSAACFDARDLEG